CWSERLRDCLLGLGGACLCSLQFWNAVHKQDHKRHHRHCFRLLMLLPPP
ncbi:unnamed protein product, partial [Brassica oleracea]